MASPSIFAMRVIRCPACHARLPVDGKAALVRCEYCDARVEIARRSSPPPTTPRPPGAPHHRAQPHYTGLAWALAIVPVLVLGGALAAYHHVQGSLVSRPPAAEPAATPKSSPTVTPTPTRVDDVAEAPRVDDPATAPEHDEPPAEPPSSKPAPSTKARTKRAPEPTGPVIGVEEARKLLEPKARACMQQAKVHHLRAYMGNKKTGPVAVLADSRTRVDGKKVKLAKTALGRCLDEAGGTVRTAAFKSNYVRLDVRNPGVPDPLGALPATADTAAVKKAIAGFDEAVKACGRKHGIEGTRASFHFTFDGPTGKVDDVRAVATNKAFARCAEAIYAKVEVTRVRASSYSVSYPLDL